jgi:hypothetical protein
MHPGAGCKRGKIAADSVKICLRQFFFSINRRLLQYRHEVGEADAIVNASSSATCPFVQIISAKQIMCLRFNIDD